MKTVEQDIKNLLADYIKYNGLTNYSEFKPSEAIFYIYSHLPKQKFTSIEEAEKFIANFDQVNAILEIFGITNPDKSPNFISIANDIYYIQTNKLLNIETINSFAFTIFKSI